MKCFYQHIWQKIVLLNFIFCSKPTLFQKKVLGIKKNIEYEKLSKASDVNVCNNMAQPILTVDVYIQLGLSSQPCFPPESAGIFRSHSSILWCHDFDRKCNHSQHVNFSL